MTPEQGETFRSVTFGVFCLAILGVYGWWSWQSQRNLKHTQDSMVRAMAARWEREHAPRDPIQDLEPLDGEM